MKKKIAAYLVYRIKTGGNNAVLPYLTFGLLFLSLSELNGHFESWCLRPVFSSVTLKLNS